MNKKYEILAEFAKDISHETPNIETYLRTRENLAKYKLNIDINSRPLKNEIVEINIIVKLQENSLEDKRSNFEITYAVVARMNKEITDKKEMEKIVLVAIPNDVYPRIQDLFITSIQKSGFTNIDVIKKVDFEKLHKENPPS